MTRRRVACSRHRDKPCLERVDNPDSTPGEPRSAAGVFACNGPPSERSDPDGVSNSWSRAAALAARAAPARQLRRRAWGARLCDGRRVQRVAAGVTLWARTLVRRPLHGGRSNHRRFHALGVEAHCGRSLLSRLRSCAVRATASRARAQPLPAVPGSPPSTSRRPRRARPGTRSRASGAQRHGSRSS